MGSEREIGRLIEWMEQAKEQLEGLTSQVGLLLASRQQFEMTKKSVKLAIFVGLSVAICALLGVCLLASPSAVKEILPLAIEYLKSAI